MRRIKKTERSDIPFDQYSRIPLQIKKIYTDFKIPGFEVAGLGYRTLAGQFCDKAQKITSFGLNYGWVTFNTGQYHSFTLPP